MSNKIPVTRVTVHRRIETRSMIDLNREQVIAALREAGYGVDPKKTKLTAHNDDTYGDDIEIEGNAVLRVSWETVEEKTEEG